MKNCILDFIKIERVNEKKYMKGRYITDVGG
jgi:hypothetical protein